MFGALTVQAQELGGPERAEVLWTSLGVEDSAGCGALDITSEAEARSPRIRVVPFGGVVPAGASAQAVVGVRLTSADGGVQAELSLRRGFGQPATRVLWVDSCREVAAAVGFVIVNVFDPPSPAPTLTAEAGQPSPLSDPVADSAGADPPSGAATPRRPTAHWHLGFGPRLQRGAAPTALFGAAAFVEVDLAPTNQLISGPKLRFEAAQGASASYAARFGEATFALTTAQLVACPLTLAHGAVALSPCALTQLGSLAAAGAAAEAARQERRLWWAVGGQLGLQWRVLPWLRLGVAAGLNRALTRYSYQFDPEVFHRVPAWGGHGGLDVALSL